MHYVRSGGTKYTLTIISSDEIEVRLNDGWVAGNGSYLGTADSVEDALSIIKSDSGSDHIDMEEA